MFLRAIKIVGLVLLAVFALKLFKDDSLFLRDSLTLTIRNKANDLAKLVAQKIRDNEKGGEAQ